VTWLKIATGVADPKMKARLADLGGIALTGSPSDFSKLIVEETEKWGKVVSSRASKQIDPGNPGKSSIKFVPRMVAA